MFWYVTDMDQLSFAEIRIVYGGFKRVYKGFEIF